MKKILITLLPLVFFLTGCSPKDELIVINSSNVLSFLEESNQTKYLYIGRPTCPNCQEFQPLLESAMNRTSQKVFYYNTDDARAEDEEVLDNIIETLEVIAVPTLLKIENGKVANEMIGVHTEAEIIEFFGED